MSQIQVPSLTSRVGPVRVPDTTVPFIDQSGIGRGLAAGLSQIAEAERDIEAAQTRVRRTAEKARLQTGMLKAFAEAAERAEEGEPKDAESIYRSETESIFENLIGDNEDPVIRAFAQERSDFLREKGLIAVRHNARIRLGAQFAANLSEHEDTLIESILSDQIDVTDAINAQAEFINEAEGIMLDPNRVKANKDAFGNRAVVAKYNAILKEDPQSAVAFLNLPVAKKYLEPDDIARRTHAAKGKLDEHLGQITNSAIEQARSMIHDLIADDDAAMDPQIFGDHVDAAVRRIRRIPGDIKFKKTPADLKVMLLEQELINSAVTGHQGSYAAIRGAMPDTAAAKAIINRADAIFNEVLDERRKAFDGAARLRAGMLTGDYANLPNDNQSLRKFYDQSKEFRVPAHDVARFLTRAGLDMPENFRRDIRSWFETETLDLKRGLDVLTAIGGHQADRMASEFGDVAKVAYQLTRHLDMSNPQDQQRRANVLDVLEHGNAKGAMEDAAIRLRGNGLTGAKEIKPIVTRVALESAGIEGVTIPQSIVDRFDAEFMFAYAKLFTEGADSEADFTTASWKAAAAAIADDYIVVDLEKEQRYLVHQSLYNIGTQANPRDGDSRSRPAFVKALQSAIVRQGVFGRMIGSNFEQVARPDQGILFDAETYVPIYDDSGIVKFLKWNSRSFAHEIVTRDNLAEFDQLVGLVTKNVPLDQIAVDAVLTFDPRSGVQSMQEWDQKHEGDGNGRMIDRFTKRAELLFIRRHQRMPNYADDSDLAEINGELERLRLRHGWPAWSTPGSEEASPQEDK